MSDSLRPDRQEPTRLLCPWDFPGKKTGVSELPFPSLGDLPNPGTGPESLMSLSLAGGWLTMSATWETLDSLTSVTVITLAVAFIALTAMILWVQRDLWVIVYSTNEVIGVPITWWELFTQLEWWFCSHWTWIFHISLPSNVRAGYISIIRKEISLQTPRWTQSLRPQQCCFFFFFLEWEACWCKMFSGKDLQHHV